MAFHRFFQFFQGDVVIDLGAFITLMPEDVSYLLQQEDVLALLVLAGDTRDSIA